MEGNKGRYRLLFVGGDSRQLRAANRTAENGVQVNALGFSELTAGIVSRIDDINDRNFDYTAVVLPLPYTTDGVNINSPEFKKKLPVSDVFQKLPVDCCVLAGKCDTNLRKLAEGKGITLIDYFDREELQILNAIPTAEGAIQIAMQETPFTLHSSECLIIGNGRIGKILAKMLSGIGARVTVAARKERDRAQIFSYGQKAINTDRLYEEIGRFDIIFNTVPTLILDSDMLAKTNRNAVIVDLASKPGGVDFEAARKMGIKVIWALSLPGKVAPDTAGDIIGKTIINILDEMEAR